MGKNFGYIAKDGMLKITTNLETVIENGVGIHTTIPYKKDNENQVGGNPEVDGKEIFVYGYNDVKEGHAAATVTHTLNEYPELYNLYKELDKKNPGRAKK